MLEKLAKQTAVYGISTIAVRFLSYLLTPVFTRVFEPEAYGIVTDVYALIPFALVVLTMGLESAYFRFAAKADAAAAAAGGTEGEIAAQARAGKRRLFATAWGVTLLAASLFFLLTAFGRERVAEWMGEAYVAHPEYVLLVAAVVWFDVAACLPFSRLREQGRAMTFVGIKALGVVVNVALAIGFALAGLYGTPFGVGWVFVANLIASAVTFNVILLTTDRTVPRIDRRLLAAVLVYSLPLLVSGVAGTANEFIDRQMIKYLVPAGAMAQLGVYGAITKIAVVMMLFTQMYRLAAEPFFLADYRKSDFVAMNAAAMKYYVMASMFIFLGIALFKDLFSLIVGADFREGIFILPVVLGMLCTMLMYNENQYDMLKQLWIVPVNKMAYFFSKFAVVLVYSVCFMLITAAASILTGVLPGYIAFDSGSVLYLLRKCMEISLLTAFAVLPILAAAAAQKGYILPVCLTLVYTFLGFILLMVNMYLHPLSSMTAIVMRDIPGVVITQPLNIPGAFLCIGVWGVASVLLAGAALKKRK